MSKDTSAEWDQFNACFLRLEPLGVWLDTSKMNAADAVFTELSEKIELAFTLMAELEDGAIANPDEERMVGHYWLREPSLAPTEEIRLQIESDIADAAAFAAAVHSGKIAPPGGGKFTDLLVIGIGGSALGPQLVADALTSPGGPMEVHFFDNTDPDGMDRVIKNLGKKLGHTLSVVISKSGGTPETRNGMLVAKAAYEAAGLNFAKHAVAVTGVGSKLDNYASDLGFIKRFPMQDWVGGRTSIMHTVGLVPNYLLGVDVAQFLQGAREMDAVTRIQDARTNPAMVMALMWHAAGQGKGAKDMVILPYKDRLVLMSKYLQQLVMESLGKQFDLSDNKVNQGLAVYGNKGSTDQHAYVQQLRDGVNNFFATFIEVREGGGQAMEVEPGVTCADYLQGFLRGTRKALAENGRESMTLSVPRVNAYYLGALIALFERAVGFYAWLVNINAYHQPGVEAGKKAAAIFLDLLAKVRDSLTKQPQAAASIASALKANPEDVWHALNHLAANSANIVRTPGGSPAADVFQLR